MHAHIRLRERPRLGVHRMRAAKRSGAQHGAALLAARALPAVCISKLLTNITSGCIGALTQIKTLVTGGGNLCRACGASGHFAHGCVQPPSPWLESLLVLREKAEARHTKELQRLADIERKATAEPELTRYM